MCDRIVIALYKLLLLHNVDVSSLPDQAEGMYELLKNVISEEAVCEARNEGGNIYRNNDSMSTITLADLEKYAETPTLHAIGLTSAMPLLTALFLLGHQLRDQDMPLEKYPAPQRGLFFVPFDRYTESDALSIPTTLQDQCIWLGGMFITYDELLLLTGLQYSSTIIQLPISFNHKKIIHVCTNGLVFQRDLVVFDSYQDILLENHTAHQNRASALHSLQCRLTGSSAISHSHTCDMPGSSPYLQFSISSASAIWNSTRLVKQASVDSQKYVRMVSQELDAESTLELQAFQFPATSPKYLPLNSPTSTELPRTHTDADHTDHHPTSTRVDTLTLNVHAPGRPFHSLPTGRTLGSPGSDTLSPHRNSIHAASLHLTQDDACTSSNHFVSDIHPANLSHVNHWSMIYDYDHGPLKWAYPRDIVTVILRYRNWQYFCETHALHIGTGLPYTLLDMHEVSIPALPRCVYPNILFLEARARLLKKQRTSYKVVFSSGFTPFTMYSLITMCRRLY